jgi:hypothetical protein
LALEREVADLVDDEQVVALEPTQLLLERAETELLANGAR